MQLSKCNVFILILAEFKSTMYTCTSNASLSFYINMLSKTATEDGSNFDKWCSNNSSKNTLPPNTFCMCLNVSALNVKVSDYVRNPNKSLKYMHNLRNRKLFFEYSEAIKYDRE